MVRIDGYMKDAIAQTIAGAVTDRHGAISVIDIFVARRHLFKHKRAKLQSQSLNLPIVWLKKLDERCWGWIFQAIRPSLRSKLLKQERIDVGVLLVALLLRRSESVAGVVVNAQQDRLATGARRLETRGHLC